MEGLLRLLFNPKPQPLVSPRLEDNPNVQIAVQHIQNPDLQIQSNDISNDPITQYQSLISQAAQQNGLQPADLAGALARESMQFNPRFVHGYHMDGTGRGIAGIDSVQHPEISDQQAMDPNFAIPWAAQQLGKLKQQTGSFYDATREYNGGPNYNSNTPGYQGIPISQLTKQHADAIKALSQQYRSYFGG